MLQRSMSSIGVLYCCFVFFFNDTATTEIYTLSLHDALPISATFSVPATAEEPNRLCPNLPRSEEHTSELQSPVQLVCRLMLEKKKTTDVRDRTRRHHALQNFAADGILETAKASDDMKKANWNYSRYDSLLFNDTATTVIYTLSLHDALPI